MIDRALLTELLRVYPWQPASAFYRAAELGHLFACGPVPPEAASWISAVVTER